MLDLGFNVVYGAKNVECGASGDYVNSGDNDICADPQLVGTFYGDTYGMMLTSSSPAIDNGDNSICPAGDYRGAARPVDGDKDGDAVCDMGAYEWLGRGISYFLALGPRRNRCIARPPSQRAIPHLRLATSGMPVK